MSTQDPRLEPFLVDLEAVLQKHNARLSSCGCCGGIGVLIGDKCLLDFESSDAHRIPRKQRP